MKSLNACGLDYYLVQATSEAPAVEPIESTDATQQIYSSSDDATLMAGCIKAARQYIESAIPGGRALVNQTLNLYLSRFPLADEALLLPRPPLQSITSIGYYDSNGSTQAMASTDYTAIAPLKRQGYVIPRVDTNWPAAKERPDSVRITYVAGYGSTGAHVPETLRLACKMLAAHWYANREAVVVGKTSKEIDLGVNSLIATENWGYYG